MTSPLAGRTREEAPGQKLLFTPADQKEAFLKAMESVHEQRATTVGRDTWQEAVEDLGPEQLFSEIASIYYRLKGILWKRPATAPPVDWKYVQGLCIDIANYAGFLYEHATEERAKGPEFC